MIGNGLPDFDFTLYDIICFFVVIAGAVIPVVFAAFFVLSFVHPVSADTMIFYPVVDARYSRVTTTQTFVNIRAGDGTGTNATENPSYILLRSHASTNGRYLQLARGGFQFNTSDLPDTATITSAKFGIYGNAKDNSLGSAGLGLTRFTPGTNGTNTVSDFQTALAETTMLSDTVIAYNDFNTSGWNNYTLNSIGLSNISKTAYTNIMLRLHPWDITGDTTGLAWVALVNTGFNFGMSETAGTTYDPYLEVTYSTEVAPVASFTASKPFIRIPNSITCTDTSTNTPTSWQWSWGDGTANSTTQNPTHQYTKRGKWDIVLTATNAGGSGTSGTTSVRVVGYENYY